MNKEKTRKISAWLKKNWEYPALILIIAAAAAVRLYHFSDWLYFAMDQARDAMLVHDAFDKGISQLPLLGPRAAGTFLRLGPAFYYFQYISAKIFNSADPAVLAYPDLFFSILSIPLFFFFLRLYFKKLPSLLTTAAYAFSFLAIEYSRFAWNPNSAPFWILACLFSLSKFSRSETQKGKMLWLGAAAAGLGFASQMHFLVFLTLPIIIALYLIWSNGWRKFDWKSTLLATIILAILYLPMALSEVKTGSDNARQFVFALQNKSNNNYTLKAKFFQNILNHANYYSMILSSYVSRTGVFSLIAGIVFVTATLLKIFFGLKDEKDRNRNNFLKLIFVWFAIIFVILILFAFQIRPRFFFPVFFLPFVFFAFWMEWLLERKKKYLAFSAAIFITLAIIAVNSEGTYAWYSSIAQQKDVQPFRNRVLSVPANHGVTLSNLKDATDYLDMRSKNDGKRIRLYGVMTYRVPIQYLMETKKPPTNYKLMGRKDENRSDYYFALTADKDGYQDIPENYREKFDLQNTYYFGERLQFFELALKDIQPDYNKQDEENKAVNKKPSKPRAKRTERVRWEDFLQGDQ
jgi:4-amino-4-deoxy-L-arabinose transferase-like glycosyltransferase